MTKAIFFDVDGTLVWHDYEKLKHVKTEKVDEVTQIRPTEAVLQKCNERVPVDAHGDPHLRCLHVLFRGDDRSAAHLVHL